MISSRFNMTSKADLLGRWATSLGSVGCWTPPTASLSLPPTLARQEVFSSIWGLFSIEELDVEGLRLLLELARCGKIYLKHLNECFPHSDSVKSLHPDPERSFPRLFSVFRQASKYCKYWESGSSIIMWVRIWRKKSSIRTKIFRIISSYFPHIGKLLYG